MSKEVSVSEIMGTLNALQDRSTPATIKEIKKQVNRARQETRAPLTSFEETQRGCTNAIGQGMVEVTDGKYHLTEACKLVFDGQKTNLNTTHSPAETQPA